eukprot:jgi/Picsp_1/6128/NSC_03482-R1_protein
MVKGKKKQGLGSKKNKRSCEGEVSPKEHVGQSSLRRFGSIHHQLSANGMYLKQIPADGNCFFRSVCDQISDQLDSTKHRGIRDHESMRREIVTFIKDRQEYFSCFVEDDEAFNDYIERMAKSEEWAGQIEIQAVSMYFSVNIRIYQDFQPPWDVINFAGNDTFIHLSYHDASHYNSVYDLKSRRPASSIHCEEGATSLEIYSPHETSKKSRDSVESETMKGTGIPKEEKGHVEQGAKIVRVQIRHVYLDDVKLSHLRVTFKFKSKKKKDSRHASGGRVVVGPNEKCPCGSNKKYKKCCKNKTLMNSEADETENLRQTLQHIYI